jgi:hypothetical protein
MSEYDVKPERERAWHTQAQGSETRHFLNAPLLPPAERVACDSGYANASGNGFKSTAFPSTPGAAR